jgi:hypothetical protein
MRRLFAAAAAVALLLTFTPAVLAADTFTHTGRVLMAFGGDVTVPAGEHADAVLVVQGTATIAGDVNAIVVIDGTAVLTGARAESVVAVRSPVTLGAGTVVTGDVLTLDSAVARVDDASVGGDVKDMTSSLVGVGFILGPALLLITLGFALVGIAAALALAALAARQVRAAGELIRREPAMTFAAGIVGAVVPPIAAVLAMMTVVGIPIGVIFLLCVWPAVAFIGYLVAAIWIGEWILARINPSYAARRPYAAAILGVLVLAVFSVVPLVTAVASLFGFGAVILLGWRTWRGGQEAAYPSGAAPQAPAWPA